MKPEEERLLKKYGICKSPSEKNKLVLMNSSEGLRHFLTKAIMFYYLVNEKKDIYTECKIKKGVIDLIDNTRKKLFEVETTLSRKKYRINEKKKTKYWRSISQINAIKIPYELKQQIKRDIIPKLEI